MTYAPGLRWGVVHGESLYTRIENLLDRHYSEVFGFPAPTVNFLAGVKADF